MFGNELQGNASQSPIKRIWMGGVEEVLIGEREAIEGSPTPCLRVDKSVVYKVYWPVVSGARTLSIDVKQAINVSPRPRVTIKANLDIGVAADVTGSAGSSAVFTTIGPLSVTPSSSGVLEVWLENLYDGGDYPAYWDNLVVT